MARAVDVLQLLDDPNFELSRITVKQEVRVRSRPDSLLLPALLLLGDLLPVLELTAVDLIVVHGLALVEEVNRNEAGLGVWWRIAPEDARLDELQRDDGVAEAALELRFEL